MIKHHPTFELIQSFVNGDLPASLSIGIKLHAEMCSQCQKQIAQLTEQVADNAFESENSFAVNDNDIFDFESIISDITESDDIDDVSVEINKTINFKNKAYPLPKALNNVSVGKTANIGKLSRARLQLDEEEIHTNLLHFNPGGGVPEHTHKGFELTVLLDGSFTDHKGEYTKGDFIMLDGTFTHQPISEKGCLCYTVANDALHFTQGINKLLNPIGNFIY
ncbi:transcriptional regulator [Psychromonas sp. RZ22]|uniref:ChrR family anti-sigma-E factor n=1 Tax=Psychromonas algarum TaxID=2555643 RepID=UPI0010687822|nr:ChrR family anti-sigma-E factor [Psychromonas sp. RZ22]TEW55262.1 transcriptional regulator [Psychromonas sp. RZ22]